MTAAKQIANARKYLAAGNARAYAAVLSAAIRAASGPRVAAALRKAIEEDTASALFIGLNTNAPVAK